MPPDPIQSPYPEEQGLRLGPENVFVPPRPSKWEFLRTRFIAGLVTVVPTLITLYALAFIVNLLDDTVGQRLLPRVAALLDMVDGPQRLAHPLTIGISFVLTVLVIVAVGILTRFLLVRRLIQIGERIVERIPLIRFFYVTPREVLKTITTTQKSQKKRVVLLEYPRKGIWCVAYATGDIFQQPGNRHMVTLFLPTTPNPTSGFLLMVPIEEVFDINMTTEDAVRFIISGGILSPSNIHIAPFAGFGRKPDLPEPEPLTTEDESQEQE